jgi:hypothetical protein
VVRRPHIFFFFFLNTERTDWGSRNSRTGTGTDRVKQENGTRKTNTRGTQEERHNPKNKRPNPPPKQKRTAVRRGGRGKTHRNTHTRDTQLKPPPKQKKTADRRRGKKHLTHTLKTHTLDTGTPQKIPPPKQKRTADRRRGQLKTENDGNEKKHSRPALTHTYTDTHTHRTGRD